MWTPSDLLTDLDLLALDRLCLTDFGVSDLTDKRKAALDWLSPRVEQAGYTLWQHATRRAPEAVFGYTGTTYVTYTSAATDTTDVDVPLSSILAVPSSAAVYVGAAAPFKGVYLGLHDAVNAQNAVLDVSVWTGAWTTVTSLVDGTQAVLGQSCSGGGLLSWQAPDTWARRSVNGERLYWVKITTASSLTAGTAAAQIAPVRASRLTLPASYYALGLLYQESYGSNRGQWQEKADKMFAAAEAGLSIALPLIRDEFDTSDDDLVTPTEVSSVLTDPNYLSTWERG